MLNVRMLYNVCGTAGIAGKHMMLNDLHFCLCAHRFWFLDSGISLFHMRWRFDLDGYKYVAVVDGAVANPRQNEHYFLGLK